MKRTTYKYAKCKKKEEAQHQLLSHGYVFYTKCLSCGEIISYDSEEKFEDHFDFFQIEDKWYDAVIDDHIKLLEEDDAPYKI